MKIFLYSQYENLGQTAAFSPRLFEFLIDQDIELEEVLWDGYLQSLPENEPVMVKASEMLWYSWAKLASYCAEQGHFLFFNDAFIDEQGSRLYEEEMIEKIKDLLKNNL